MYHDFSFQEMTVLLLSLPVLVMSIIALIDIDAVNNAILKKRGTNAYDPWISNKEAWKAGFEVFMLLFILSLISIGMIYIYQHLNQGGWLKILVMWILFITLSYFWILIVYNAIKNLTSR